MTGPGSTKTLLRVGVTGTVITAICCFTPVLVILLGTVGLATLTGYLDYILLPMLAVFVGITLYALVQKLKQKNRSPGEKA